MMRLPRPAAAVPSVVLLLACLCLGAGWAAAASPRGPQLPEIRISRSNGVPACVTPERLMRYLAQRNAALDPRYRDIAALYKKHGEALRIRWDYAFFQMLLETNYLTFKRGDGESGDVRARQNNFAGIGATGGGVPGNSFPDVSTGVLAQMQHLLAYAGQRVEAPVAARTRENQGDIVEQSLALRRPVRFSDLTNRWAADRNYARSLDVIATRFREGHCLPDSAPEQHAATEAWSSHTRVEASVSAHAKPSTSRSAGMTCDVWAASFGGTAALLIRSVSGSTVNYTVLEVEKGREQPQADAYMGVHARNGETIARFASRELALARAFELCPGPS